MAANTPPLPRYCLVTVGATTGFEALTREVLDPDFWHFLRSDGFTALHVQCGPDVAWAAKAASEAQHRLPKGFSVDVFDVKKNLKEEMLLCRARPGLRAQGVVISHAGTGTILDAWRMGLSLVVVPNTGLLNDHQSEMARHVAKQGYASVASASRLDLQEAIYKAVLLREENPTTRWPAHSIQRTDGNALRLWDIKPVEVNREEASQMSHD
ncbi:UDP-N-acetylglucosamine transferase subunit alg13 [Moelleriella libera RCEF 2490]|uniref:UDP-N-acetylglucosamine transferase subunit ALG13 n=1 Tax=Moelleriella libera RCEF 2490 TaxID=1081109 RepID=A0A166VMR3_9HYPO|nr:UDP-N-acetylglucosamine transferase subunit alg13 [Moelleriella libera RCEF 2490]